MRVLTNSLAANDVAMVYGGYSKARPDLLAGGVKIWELKPLPGTETEAEHVRLVRREPAHQGAGRRFLQTSFVGSYNLDPRSTSLNCEQGVFVDEPVIAAQLEALFDEESTGERAWAVTLDDGKLRWSDGKHTYDDRRHKPLAARSSRPGSPRCCRWIRSSRTARRERRGPPRRHRQTGS